MLELSRKTNWRVRESNGKSRHARESNENNMTC